MNEDTFNIEIRKYLKTVGITSQREIEQAVYKAIESGKLEGSEILDVKMTLEVPGGWYMPLYRRKNSTRIDVSALA